jgi:O-antigen/teichoic acid export membrane protein
MRYGLSLSVAVLATQLYARLDYLVLSQLASPNRAATYAAAYNLVLGMSLVPIALTRVATSHISSEDSPPRGRRDYLGIALLTGLVGGAIIAAAGPVSARALFRLDDPQLTLACLILGGAFVFMSINSTIGVLAPKGGTERRYFAVVASALIVNLVVCLALIPSLGMLGASAATALTEIFVALAWWTIARRGTNEYLRQPPAVSPVDL